MPLAHVIRDHPWPDVFVGVPLASRRAPGCFGQTTTMTRRLAVTTTRATISPRRYQRRLWLVVTRYDGGVYLGTGPVMDELGTRTSEATDQRKLKVSMS